TIRIKDTDFTPKLYLEARVIAGDESFMDPTQDKYVFGDYREITDPNEELRKIYNRILSKFGEKQEMLDQLDKLVKEANETASNAKKESEAAKTLAEKVQENMKNNTVEMIEAKNPPTTGLKPNKTLWRDMSNGKPGILKIWTGTAWESVVPDVESIKKDTLMQVNKDIENTKTELNKKVEEAQSQATGQFNKVQEGLQGVSRTISTIENKQGEIDKKVTQFEQDSNGFKTSIESLTKKDNDISNKLNTVESTVEGTKKTISDVQQTTSELKQKTTEMKEEAGKISEKLTSVETKVNSDKAGGRNLLLQSNVKYEKTDYLINQYSLTENFFADEVYTFVIKGSVPQGQKFGICQNGGSNNVGYATSVYANGITYVTFKAVAGTSGNERKLSLYNYPSSTTKSIVEWVALYKGNKPQDWTAPPEEQVTTDEFTKKTTEIVKNVDGIKETITKVENNQNGFDKRVATVEKDANTIKQNVSSIQNTQTEQGRQLQEAKAGWENTAKALQGKVELKQVENYVAGFKIPELKQTVDKNKQDLLGELANKLATEQFNQKMTLIDNRFTINELGINASAKKTEVYTKEQANGQFATSSYVRDMETRLQLTEKGVSISVKENDVIAAFNMSKENITLNANRINLVGFITANHIKGKVLEGVTLKTSGNRFVEINKQDMKIFDLDKPRGYIGFMETDDGSIQPSLVLGSDNRKYAGTGSFYIYQVMPRMNGVDQPSKAYAKFGISKGENAEGTNIWSNYIQMHNDGGHLSVYSDGQFRFQNLNNIIFESEGWAPGYGYFSVTTTEPHIFTNNAGQFTFKRKGSDYKIHFINGATDHDLIMGNAMIRSSFIQGYNNGLQIKDMMGQGWKDIELRTLRAQENVNANGQMWAKAFNPTSARNMKENIKDIPFSALDKIMSLAIKQYNFKDDMYDLYQMRVNKPEEQTEPYTTKEIETYFGMIADDTEDIFTDKAKRAINLYNTVSIFIAAFQQQNHEFNEALTTVKGENNQLKEQVVTLTNDVSTLKELVKKLINEKLEQP
ncbi:TPA: tail fiber domain-containing protein, partial [Bacillus cereus]|nr:tail fiber domain-containing protein [Bacillus cereus]HDR8461711.1 tail fiber domain-containing protein [Bacillus cereus]